MKVVVACAVLAAVSLACALRLELRTDFAELLPRDHPSVAALRRLAEHERLGSSLILIIEGRERDAFVERLRPRLEALGLFAQIDWGPDPELQAFKRRWRWLYADVATLTRVEELLGRLLVSRATPLAITLDDPKEELHQLLPAPAKMSWDDGRRRGVLLWRRREGVASASDRQALQAVRAQVTAARPDGVVVRYTGHIAQALEEQDAIRQDLTLATAVCTALILFVIWLYFRRIPVVLAVGAPAVLGVLVALAVASFTLGALNLNTAFLVAIILGNGINSPIVLFARYGEERRRGTPDPMGAAIRRTWRGTLAAMGAASVAYGSLLATDFRGFSQFGWLGGMGMLLVWAFTYVLLPPLARLVDLAPRENRLRFAPPRSSALLVVCALATVAAIGPIHHLIADPLEWDLRKLRPAHGDARELWQEAEALGMTNPDAGYVGSHGALLVDRPEQADAVAEALRDPMFKSVRTLSSLVPADQERKLALLARIRARIDRHASLLAADELAFRPPSDLRAMTAADLPPIRAFTERDGTVGRLVLVSVDHARYSDWNGHDLLRLSQRLRVSALGRTWTAASPATIFAGMIETLLYDGPRVAAIALGGVILLVLIVLGRRALPALATQAVGVVWFAGLAAALGLKINCFNFVAIPITLGVGADYAANLVNDPQAGPAVTLCSLTTIIGYSSLLISDNPALRSFGLLADLGELTCLLAALLFLPSLARLTSRAS